VQGLLEVHDEVAAHIQNSLEEVKYIDGVSSGEESEEEGDKQDKEDKADKSDSSEEIVDTFRVIGLRRKKGESLVRFFTFILVKTYVLIWVSNIKCLHRFILYSTLNNVGFV
jgi:hypothetical protein